MLVRLADVPAIGPRGCRMGKAFQSAVQPPQETPKACGTLRIPRRLGPDLPRQPTQHPRLIPRAGDQRLTRQPPLARHGQVRGHTLQMV